jgi:Uma2 family endonuclease
MAATPLLSTEDYIRTSETLLPTEVVYGALRVADAPAVRHQQAVGAFYLALAPHVHQRRAGRVLLSPLDVVLDWDRALILQPDLIFVSHARWQVRREKVVGAPDIVLEILSPNPRIGDLAERIAWFAQYGVREIWLLHQLDERFEILHARDGRVVTSDVFDYDRPIHSSVLPDFRTTVADILRW